MNRGPGSRLGGGSSALTTMLVVAALSIGVTACHRKTPNELADRWSRAPSGEPFAEGIHLSGRLVGPDGVAVAGAELRYVPDAATLMAVVGDLPARDGEFAVEFPGFSIDEIAPVVTRADGRFDFQAWRSMDRSEGNWTANQIWSSAALIVTAPGFATRLIRHHWTGPPEKDFGDVALEVELAIEGVVVDEGGDPIPGARVRVEHSGTWDELQREFDLPKILRLGDSKEIHSDGEGRFRLGGLAAGGHHFSIERDGFGRAVSWIAGASGMTVRLDRVTLAEVAGICGVVRDDGGAVVSGAKVWLTDAYFDRGITPGFLAGPPLRDGETGWTDPLTWAFRERGVPSVTSNSRGEFCAFGSGGPAYDLYAVADGYAMSRIEDVRDGRADIEVALETRTTPVAPDPYMWAPIVDPTIGELEVLVRDEGGRPVTGAAIFGSEWSFEDGEPIGHTNEDGILVSEVRRVGARVVHARSGSRWSERQKINWESSSRPSATLKLVESGGIVGVARKENGEVDPYAWLSVTPLDIPRDLFPNRPDERADEAGRFEFSDLLPGRYEVTSNFRFQAWQGTEVTVRGGEAADAIVSVAGAKPRLRGSVRSGGRPVVLATVEGRLSDPDRIGYYMAYSLRDGVYDAWADPAGDYDLTVETVGGGRLKPTRVTIGEGEIARADFRLPTGGVTGAVVARADGAPVGGILVGLFGGTNKYVARATDFTDAEGRFDFSELEDGEYFVRTMRAVWNWPDYARQTYPMMSVGVVVRDASTTRATLLEPDTVSLSGYAVNRQGVLARDGTQICLLRDTATDDPGRVEDPCVALAYTRSGAFRFSALLPGVYRALTGEVASDSAAAVGESIDLLSGSAAGRSLIVEASPRPRRIEETAGRR